VVGRGRVQRGDRGILESKSNGGGRDGEKMWYFLGVLVMEEEGANRNLYVYKVGKEHPTERPKTGFSEHLLPSTSSPPVCLCTVVYGV
jgi:hypothetical protein